MRAKWLVQFSIQAVLFLVGVGGIFVPQIDTWLYSGIIWGIAFIWLMVTLFLYLKSRKITKLCTQETSEVKIDEKTVVKPYENEWEHYKNLRELFIRLQHVSGKERLDILDNIERERTILADNELQEWIDKFLNAEKWHVEFGQKPDNEFIRRVNIMTLQRMNKRYKR